MHQRNYQLVFFQSYCKLYEDPDFFLIKPRIRTRITCYFNGMGPHITQHVKLCFKLNFLIMLSLIEVLQSNPIKLYSMGLFEGKGLCQQTNYDFRAKREHQTRKRHGKLHKKLFHVSEVVEGIYVSYFARSLFNVIKFDFF